MISCELLLSASESKLRRATHCSFGIYSNQGLGHGELGLEEIPRSRNGQGLLLLTRCFLGDRSMPRCRCAERALALCQSAHLRPRALDSATNHAAVGSGPQLNNYRDLDDKKTIFWASWRKMRRSRRIIFTCTESNALRIDLVEFSGFSAVAAWSDLRSPRNDSHGRIFAPRHSTACQQKELVWLYAVGHRAVRSCPKKRLDYILVVLFIGLPVCQIDCIQASCRTLPSQLLFPVVNIIQ